MELAMAFGLFLIGLSMKVFCQLQMRKQTLQTQVYFIV